MTQTPATQVERHNPVLSVQGLTVEYATAEGTVHAVTDLSFELYPHETLGIVGESGSGKTATCLAICGLLPEPTGRIVEGVIEFRGANLARLKSKELRKLRGAGIAMIFQESASALNPVATIGRQISEALRVHRGDMSRSAIRAKSVGLLETVGIPEASKRYDQYPHELSGGMRQRVMIAIAIANNPTVLVADEPTTALDVTIQAQIVEVLQAAQRVSGAATILVTHDLGLVSLMADRVIVMYAGRVVEAADVYSLFSAPRHPYTIGLLASVPRLTGDIDRLTPIPGQPPSLLTTPAGCPFAPRCSLCNGRSLCHEQQPDLRHIGQGGRVACHFAEELIPPAD